MSNTNKVNLKRYDATLKKWDEIRLQSSADITVTAKPITVQNDVGAYHAGASIPAGTKLSDIMTNLAKQTTHPVYTAPTHAVTFAKDTDWAHYTADGEKYPVGVIYDLKNAVEGKHIAGQLIHTKVSSVITKNDGGDVSSHTITIKVNGSPLETGVQEPQTSPDNLTVTRVFEYQSKPGDKIEVEVAAEYAAGAVKTDNHGAQDPVGKIEAGRFNEKIVSEAALTFVTFAADAETQFETADSYRKAFEKEVADDSRMMYASEGSSLISTLTTKPRLIIAAPSSIEFLSMINCGVSVAKTFEGSKKTAKIQSYARFDELTAHDDIHLRPGTELEVEYTIYDINLGQTPINPFKIESVF